MTVCPSGMVSTAAVCETAARLDISVCNCVLPLELTSCACMNSGATDAAATNKVINFLMS